MPVQQTTSSLAKKLGGRVAAANEVAKDQPVDTGNRRLPAGIRDGVARLASLYWKEYEDDKSFPGARGQLFFRGSAVVVQPVEHAGMRVAGMVTSVIVPLCDTPQKGQRKATKFEDNWAEFQNIIRLLGVAPCPETKATDPTGVKTEAYFLAAMKSLTDPVRMKSNPVYISFSTRGWTPPASAQQPKPEEMVFETWHGLADYHGQPDPAAGVTTTAPSQPSPTSLPPGPSHNGPPTLPVQIPEEEDLADLVTRLVEVAMNDPEGATEEGAAASAQLEQAAWDAGWSKEQTAAAADWAEVGEMALNEPEANNVSTTEAAHPSPTVSSRWMFAKRTKEGAKLRNNRGEEFPPQEVEVVSVDEAARTCTVKTIKDGKPVIDIRTKQPVQAKFEWLEPLPF